MHLCKTAKIGHRWGRLGVKDKLKLPNGTLNTLINLFVKWNGLSKMRDNVDELAFDEGLEVDPRIY